MRKKISILAALHVVLISSGILIISCSKTGPAGPAGATGPQGPQGPQGVQGPQGNANVFADTFTLHNADWLASSDYWYTLNSSVSIGAFTRFHDQNVSELTSGILDSGMVLVFFRSSAVDTNMWTPLPFSFPAQGLQYYYNYAFETEPGNVRLHYFYTPNVVGATLPDLLTDVIADHKFKIILITGQLTAGMKHDGINPRNYRQVIDYLGSQ